MTSVAEADSWIGRAAVDSSGEQIGMITAIWVDDDSGQAEWASLRSSGLGRREVLVPLAGVTAVRSSQQFAFSKDHIVGSPRLDQDGRLAPEDKARLVAYYGGTGTAPRTDSPDQARPTIESLMTHRDELATPPADKQPRRRFRRKQAVTAPEAIDPPVAPHDDAGAEQRDEVHAGA